MWEKQTCERDRENEKFVLSDWVEASKPSHFTGGTWESNCFYNSSRHPESAFALSVITQTLRRGKGGRRETAFGVTSGTQQNFFDFSSTRFVSSKSTYYCVSIPMTPWVGRDEPEEQRYPPKESSLADDDSSVTAVRECRMCFEKQLSANDPVLQLGCNCLGESSWAHESCIRKWFPRVCVHKGAIACEICKGKLGRQPRSIVKGEIWSRVFRYLLLRGVAPVGETIGRIIITVAAEIQALNDKAAVRIWECFH